MPGFRRLLITLLLLVGATAELHAQQSISYAVIDGTQDPPRILFSDADIQIADTGAGRYTLTFESPVVFLLGTSLSLGPGFDVARTFLSATRNSADRRQVKIGILQIPLADNASHAQSDALFSLKFILAPALIFENGFE